MISEKTEDQGVSYIPIQTSLSKKLSNVFAFYVAAHLFNQNNFQNGKQTTYRA
ncbi:hypothetical Protein YC6258_03350 [Gynuella sunshinyii YC6258]|uniref:Uncharacterized protein n=1 Tax=Gynuella sunshinyii YC6258 TaxID=1445510 RepID=A0A0C5V7I9_9GAMM|nr:hypothetical Protein YC6258_03350 [Gynuella sunshinyii YC6258]